MPQHSYFAHTAVVALGYLLFHDDGRNCAASGRRLGRPGEKTLSFHLSNPGSGATGFGRAPTVSKLKSQLIDPSFFDARDRTLFTWLGGAGVLINSRGTNAMIDP